MGIFVNRERNKRVPYAMTAWRLSLVLSLLMLFPSLASAGVFSITTNTDIRLVTVMTVTGSENYFSTSDNTFNSGPRNAIAQKFFETHRDEYDFLVIFTNFDFAMPQASV